MLSTWTVAGDDLITSITLSYDINCQFSKHFAERAKEYPNYISMDVGSFNMQYAIPKFHLPGHGRECWTKYSFNYLRGAGRTCGEVIEQGWAAQNPLVNATIGMGEGGRQETLDDHLGHTNWRKTTQLCAHHMHHSCI